MIRLFITASVVLFGTSHALQMCPSANSLIPPNAEAEPVQNFPFAESGLQIFTQMRVPCEGSLIQWRFIARNSLVLGLHLGIFRPRPGVRNVVDLVAESYIDSLSTPNNARGTWVYYPVEPPLSVKTGDYLGLFYDRLDTVADLLTIVSKSKYDLKELIPPTAVLLKDASDLAINRTIDARNADRQYRYPALVAVVRSFFEVQTTTTPRRPPTTTTTELPTTFEIETTPETTPRPRPTLPPITLPPTLPPTPARIYPPTPAPFQAISIDNRLPNSALSGRCLNPPTALQTCTKLALRGFFDYDRGLCRPFYGCESFSPEANNFGSVNDCRALCEPIGAMLQLPQTTPRQTAPFVAGELLPPSSSVVQQQGGAECYLPPSASTFCSETTTRFYHDSARGTCYSFYGCALINQIGNNFATMEECTRRCNAKASPVPPVPPQQTGVTSKPSPYVIQWVPESTTLPYMPTPIRPFSGLAQPIEVIDDTRNYRQPSFDYDNSNLNKYIVAQPPSAYGPAPSSIQQPIQAVQPVQVQTQYLQAPAQAPVSRPTYYQDNSEPVPFQGGIFNALPTFTGTAMRNPQYSGQQPPPPQPSAYQQAAAPSPQYYQAVPVQQVSAPSYSPDSNYQQPRSASRAASAHQPAYSGGVPAQFFSTIFNHKLTDINTK